MPSRVNLVGYSMGGTVIDRIARDLKTRTTQVNTIIGIDPAAGRIQAPAYAQNSAYAISFCGNDAVAKLTASQSGDDTVVLTGLDPNNDMLRHQSVFTVVTTMWERDGGTPATITSAACSPCRRCSTAGPSPGAKARSAAASTRPWRAARRPTRPTSARSPSPT
jgi:pimeloyl-ACP methyl ester carboxylesterase